MEIIPNYGRHQNIVKENHDLRIINNKLQKKDGFSPSTTATAGIKYSNCNNTGELRVPSVSFSHCNLQIPEEIQVEPIFEYYQNSNGDNECTNNDYQIGEYQDQECPAVTITSQYNHSQQLNITNYQYEEPEENFISIDDVKAKPFLFNASKNDKKTNSKPKITQKDVELVIIDDDDEDDCDNDREEEVKQEDDDVILIEDDDESEVGEGDWIVIEGQDKQTFECFLCQKKVASNYNLRRHMMIHTGERPFGCDICLKRFREFSDLKKHRRVHSHEKNYKCMVCKMNAPSQTNPTKCNSCDQEDRQHRINYSDVAIAEIPCIEGSDKKAYVCPICDRIFGSRHNLKRHFMIHTGEKPYKCDVCDKAFREVSTLKKHMLTHSRIKLFKCTICGKDYSDFGSYTRHKTAHRDINIFGSNSNAMNTRNMASAASVAASAAAVIIGDNYNNGNEEDYLFECGDCHKKFSNASIYKEHLKLHSRDFTFQCYICKKMFRTKEKLNAHFVIHESDEIDEQNRRQQRQ